MTYFPDLSPYAYGHGSHPGVVHIGWLDSAHPFPKGSVDPRLTERIRLLAAKPVELYRGFHVCNLCQKPDLTGATLPPHRSNGEIRISYDGLTFAAPVLLVHYIEVHGYLPPPDFLKAVEQASP